MKKINWQNVFEKIATTIGILIGAMIVGWAFFMLYNMFRELIRNW